MTIPRRVFSSFLLILGIFMLAIFLMNTTKVQTSYSLRSKRFQRARSELLFRPRENRASAKINWRGEGRRREGNTAFPSPLLSSPFEFFFFFALALFSRGGKNRFASRPLETLATQAKPPKVSSHDLYLRKKSTREIGLLIEGVYVMNMSDLKLYLSKRE